MGSQMRRGASIGRPLIFAAPTSTRGGFTGALLESGGACEDGWLFALGQEVHAEDQQNQNQENDERPVPADAHACATKTGHENASLHVSRYMLM